MTDKLAQQLLDAELLYAMSINDVEKVKEAFARGADPNARDGHGRSMLGMVAEWGYTEIVQLFIDKGANVDPEDGQEITPLMHAAFRGHADTVRLLINSGAEINRYCATGVTPLIMSVYPENGAETVRLLVENGADITAKNSGGLTALQMAEFFEHKEIVSLLKQAPAIVEALRAKAAHETASEKQEYLKQRALRSKMRPEMRP